MKFSIERNKFLNNLQLLSKVIPTRSTLPIINCCLFTIKNKNLNMRTTDLEISISINNDVNVEEDGSIAIPMNKLIEITSAITDDIINIDVSNIGKVNIICNQGKYTIMGQSHEEFPKEQNIEDNNKFIILGQELKNIIINTTYATSRDDLKPVLQGVLFKINNDGFISVATDGHRLVKYEKSNIKKNEYTGTVVVPTKFLSLLNNQIDVKEEITMFVADNHILIETNYAKIISRIIKEPYPDYEGVIPKDNTQTLVIDKEIFSEAIKRVSIFSNKSSKQVALDISENNIIISTEDPENITSGKETLDCQYDGEPMTIGYNASYLREVLQHQQTNEIKIMLKSPINAGLFLPMEQNENEKKTTLLMPIRLND